MSKKPISLANLPESPISLANLPGKRPISLADLSGNKCYKLKVIEYYYDNSNREIDWKKRNFRITFQIDGITDCSGTSYNVNNINQNYEIKRNRTSRKNQ